MISKDIGIAHFNDIFSPVSMGLSYQILVYENTFGLLITLLVSNLELWEMLYGFL